MNASIQLPLPPIMVKGYCSKLLYVLSTNTKLLYNLYSMQHEIGTHPHTESLRFLMSPSGGRRTLFVRKWKIWDHLRDFFPIKVRFFLGIFILVSDMVFFTSSNFINLTWNKRLRHWFKMTGKLFWKKLGFIISLSQYS